MDKRSIITAEAERHGMEVQAFQQTLMATVMPGGNVQPTHVAAFCLVSHKYQLNPFTKEIYAFPAKGGGIQPIVSVDGWAKIINGHPNFDGMTFEDQVNEKGDVTAITCRMYRKDRQHPVEATEYMAECRRNTEPWKQWPRRMLRHKAMIQAARYAFSFSGIVDEDEAGRIQEAHTAEAVAAATGTPQNLQDLTAQIESAPPQAEPASTDEPQEADFVTLDASGEGEASGMFPDSDPNSWGDPEQ